jgi:hypothetical protein
MTTSELFAAGHVELAEHLRERRAKNIVARGRKSLLRKTLIGIPADKRFITP